MKIYTLIFALILSNLLLAKKKEVPFEILVVEAEQIVQGEIVDTTDSTYTIDVIENLCENSTSISKMTINKWEAWQCDNPKFKYEIGIKVLLFLKKQFKEESFAVLHGSSGELKIDGGRLNVWNYGEVDLLTLSHSIKYLRQCYNYKGDYWADGYLRCYLESTCSEKETAKFWNENKFNSWVYESAIERKIFEKKWLYVLDYKEPENIVKALRYVVKTKDSDIMNVICDPYYWPSGNLQLLESFNEDDSATVDLIDKLKTEFTIEEIERNKEQYICYIKKKDEILFWVVLVNRYSNWYIEQIREP